MVDYKKPIEISEDILVLDSSSTVHYLLKITI